jgi:hypothetical protein
MMATVVFDQARGRNLCRNKLSFLSDDVLMGWRKCPWQATANGQQNVATAQSVHTPLAEARTDD